jgi:hypothetical protein
MMVSSQLIFCVMRTANLAAQPAFVALPICDDWAWQLLQRRSAQLGC